MGMSSLSLSLSADCSSLSFDFFGIFGPLPLSSCINYVQYERGCAVQVWVCSKNHQYKRGCAVQVRMCSTSKVDHQVLVQGNTTQKYFPMNESLLLLIYRVKVISSL